MHGLEYLKDFVVILGVAVVVVTILHRLRIPSIAGFILAGILIGPQALGLIHEPEQVELLAEVGVALLLFGIGLELPLDRLKKLWRPILYGGALQVAITVGSVFLISLALGFPANVAIFLGALIALSSTAIVLRGLEARGEMDAPHGKLTLGILVFQDLCVVPMMLLVPVLAGGSRSALDIAVTLLEAAAVIVGVLLTARLIVPRILGWIARTRQRHLFIMTVLIICLGTAWITSLSGVSLALGAFLAGLVVAGSEYRHQALADMIAFRDVFTSVFFVSVGMLLSPADVVDNLGTLIVLLAGVIVLKFIVVFAVGMLMRLSMRVSLLAGAGLAQIGEFAFVLATAGLAAGLIDDDLMASLVAVSILSMLLTPFGLSAGPRIAAGVGRVRKFQRWLDVATAEEADVEVKQYRDHVIIGGYGFVGQQLARALRAHHIPYVIVELNMQTVSNAGRAGEPIYYGDITSPEVLEHVGARRARELVLVINDPSALIRAIKGARQCAPDLHIVVRTLYLMDVGDLIQAGANQIVPAELEAGVEITRRVLERHTVGDQDINLQLEYIRSLREETPPGKPPS